MANKHCLVPGTYCTVKGKEEAEFAKKLGFPMADKLCGSHWKMTCRNVDGTFVAHMTCEEIPEVSEVISIKPGVETCVNSPLFGGKSKLLAKETGDNCFKGTGESECFGKFTWEEKFTDCGYEVTWNCEKAGAPFTEKWCRVVKEEGFFKFVKGENMEAYMKATGTDATGLDMSCMVQAFFKCGDKMKLVEFFGDKKVVSCYKLDEEIDYCMEGFPSFNRKMMVSRTGPGKFKILTKRASDGGTEEWNCTVCDEGMCYQAKDHKTGTTCCLKYERFCCVSGDFQYIGSAGFEQMAKVMGIPDDFACKVVSDFESVVCIREKPGGIVHFKHKSKYMPMDMMIKWDEEFDMQFPGMPDKMKVVDTKCGNKIMSVARCPKYTMTTTVTITDNFFVQHSKIVGTNVQMKVFRKRICC